MTKPPPARDSAGTFISRLTLTDFRNYASLGLALEPGIIVLHGENGAGKTNLLEAVSLLSPGRGMRRATFPSISTRTSSFRTSRSARTIPAPAKAAPSPGGGLVSGRAPAGRNDLF